MRHQVCKRGTQQLMSCRAAQQAAGQALNRREIRRTALGPSSVQRATGRAAGAAAAAVARRVVARGTLPALGEAGELLVGARQALAVSGCADRFHAALGVCIDRHEGHVRTDRAIMTQHAAVCTSSNC